MDWFDLDTSLGSSGGSRAPRVMWFGIPAKIEAFICFIFAAAWVAADPAKTEHFIKEALNESELLHFSDVINRLTKNPSPFKELALAACCVRLLVSIMLIYGAYYMKHLFLVPFLLLEAIRLGFLVFLHISAMQIVKQNSQDLGLLIVATLAGFFVLLLLIYTWVCVYSLYRVLWRLRPTDQPKAINRRPLDTPDFPPKLYPAYPRSSYRGTIAPIY